MEELPVPPELVPEVYELVKRDELEPVVELLPPYELKTMPGFRMPRADECLSSEFQSVLSDEELLLLPDILVEDE